jgi:hypothetical protein
MHNNINELFACDDFTNETRKYLPALINLVNSLCDRNGKLTQEVGRLREEAIKFHISRYCGESVEQEPAMNELVGIHDKKDCVLFNRDVSIKTTTGKSVVKIDWSDDKDENQNFLNTYIPEMDLMFLNINWGATSYLYYIPENAQKAVIGAIGNANYLKLSKSKRNKGVSIQTKALKMLKEHPDTLCIEIDWPAYKYQDVLGMMFETCVHQCKEVAALLEQFMVPLAA